MFRCSVFVLLVFATNLIASQSRLALIQNGEGFTATLEAIKNGLIVALPGNEEAIRAQFSKLESLPSSDANERNALLQTFFNEQMNLFLPKLGFPQNILAEYRGLLGESDRNLLRKFHDITLQESSFILVYPENHLSTYKNQEATEYKPTWGELISVLREMLMELSISMHMVDSSTTLEILKTVTQAYPEYAEGVFSRNEVTGDFLVLPLIVVQKLHESAPRKNFGTKHVTISGANDSKVLEELENQGVTLDEVIELLIKRIVRYYEKLGKVVFCKLRERVNQVFGPSSVAAIAFNFADAHACSNMEEETPKKKSKPSRRW